MEQLSIFHELGFIEDSIYRQLSSMECDEVINIEEITVTKNQVGLFEISSRDVHEGFKTVESVYAEINRILCPLVRVIL